MTMRHRFDPIDMEQAAQLHAHRDGGYQEDRIVEGLALAIRVGEDSWRPQSEWRFVFDHEFTHFSSTLGFYPDMALDQARALAIAKRKAIDEECAPPTLEECAGYDHALARLKSGDWTAGEEVKRGLARIAQVPRDSVDDHVKLRDLPPSTRLLVSIDTLSIGVRAFNALHDNGLRIVAHLLLQSDAELLRLPNLGRKSLNGIKQALELFLVESKLDEPQPPEPSLALAVSLQRKIIVELETQTRLMHAALAVLEKLGK
jgi:hypothetical protein